MAQAYPFKWRHYQPEIILLCVGWYLRETIPNDGLNHSKGLLIANLHTRIPALEVVYFEPVIQAAHLSTTVVDLLFVVLAEGNYV